MRSTGMLLLVATACSSAPPRERTPEPPPVALDAAPSPPDAAPPDAIAVDAPPAAAERIELTFAGDVTFGGRFNGHWSEQDVERHDPFEGVTAMLASDLPLINLETTVAAEIPELDGNLRFVATPSQVAILLRHGITAVTIANNHINDLDRAGVIETPIHLRELGITMIGAPRAEPPRFRVETVEVKGWTIGFVAATTKLNRAQKKGDPEIPFVDKADLAESLVPVIAAARPDHDLVIVVLHWGVQYDDEPSRWQVEAAHAFVEAGADAVIGHHPHVLQAIERHEGGVIAYSLGNFVFQNATKIPRLTGVLRLGFRRDTRCLDLLAFHPAVMHRGPVHRPLPAENKEPREIEARLNKLSETPWSLEGDRLVAPAACPR